MRLRDSSDLSIRPDVVVYAQKWIDELKENAFRPDVFSTEEYA